MELVERGIDAHRAVPVLKFGMVGLVLLRAECHMKSGEVELAEQDLADAWTELQKFDSALFVTAKAEPAIRDGDLHPHVETTIGRT